MNREITFFGRFEADILADRKRLLSGIAVSLIFAQGKSFGCAVMKMGYSFATSRLNRSRR